MQIKTLVSINFYSRKHAQTTCMWWKDVYFWAFCFRYYFNLIWILAKFFLFLLLPFFVSSSICLPLSFCLLGSFSVRTSFGFPVFVVKYVFFSQAAEEEVEVAFGFQPTTSKDMAK